MENGIQLDDIWTTEETNQGTQESTVDQSVLKNKPNLLDKDWFKQLDNLPPDIKRDRNFVTWIAIKKANGKLTKIPASVETGKPFSPGTNAHMKPELWTNLKTLLEKGYPRAWYWTSKSNRHIFIDIDDCVSWVDGKPVIIPEATEILRKFDSYAELSPSLEGIRIAVNGETPLDRGYRGVKKIIDGNEIGFEIIAYERGATLTGFVIERYDKPVKENQEAIDWYCYKYLSKYIQRKSSDGEKNESSKKTSSINKGIPKKEKLFDEINDRLNFRIFIALHKGISVKSSGEKTKHLICPHCSNQSSSKRKQDSALAIYDESIFCFRCEKSWNVWSYLQDFEGFTGKDRIETLANYAGLDLSQYNRADIKQTEAKAEGIPYYRLLAREFYDHQPYHYDRSKLYWIWDKDKLVWQIRDETDLLNAFEGFCPEKDTSIANVKNRLLLEVEKIGRKNKPEEPGNSWIQFNRTIIDFNNLELRISPDPGYNMTNVIPWNIEMETGIKYLDFEDADLILEKSDTPYIDKLLMDWVGVENLKTMYEIIGFVMIRDYPLNRIISLLGEGSNGKSCFIRLLEMILGTGNYTSSDLHWLSNKPFETAKLYNKLMCTINEIDHSVFKQTALLKRLTGGDLIPMEIKFKNPFEAKNYAKLIIASNTLPQTNDKSYGFFRRWLIIDFPNRFEEGRDPVLDIPDDEISKLCGKAVKLIPGLLERGSFINEGNLEQRKTKYESRSSSLMEFINGYCDQVEREFIICSEFIEEYRRYCRDNNYIEKSNKAIGKEMTQLGFPSEQRNIGYNRKVYANLKWKNGI